MINKYQLKIQMWEFLEKNLPFDLLQKYDLKKRSKSYLSNKVIFIHIPKSAGSSVTKAIYGKRLGHHRAVDIKNSLPDIFENNYKFSMVRNPWSRVFSAYQFVSNKGGGNGAIYHRDIYDSPQFVSFEKFVLEWLSTVNLEHQDGVFVPQYKYLLDENEQSLVDFVGKVETFDETLKIVSDRLGRKLESFNINTSKTLGQNYKNAFTNEMIEIVGEKYKKDIALFNYSFE